MNIARTLLKSILQQLVDDIDYVFILSVRIF